MNILQTLPRPFMVLAPMDDVTDVVFRQIVRECAAPDLFYTEFVNADGLQSPGRSRLLKKLKTNPEDQPLIAQIWGKNPDNFRTTAAELVDMGFAGVDLNMGCPIKAEVNNGTCSALINNRPLAVELIAAVKEGVAGRLPVSVKTRLGFNEVDLSWHELLLSQGIDMLIVHGRTRKQMSAVPADWEMIGKIRELRDRIAPGTLIVGNGDVQNREQASELARAHKLDGIMIGRGVFHDPFAFAASSPWQNYTKAQRIAVFTRQVELFAQTWKQDERPIHTLNKFCKIYVNGFEGAKECREQLMDASSPQELLDMLKQL